MKLLVSPKNKDEALQAVWGGADIIDVKNPAEGSLGANYPWVISDILGVVPDEREVSAALGDFNYLPGTASLTARGALSLGVDYIKIGLYGVMDYSKGLHLASSVTRSVREYGSDVKVVIAGYADWERIDSLSPDKVLRAVINSGADVFMLDTALKDGSNLFDYLSVEDLSALVSSAHDKGLLCAVGGSLDIPHINDLYESGVDILGVRGAVCSRNDRLEGRIEMNKVSGLKRLMNNIR